MERKEYPRMEARTERQEGRPAQSQRYRVQVRATFVRLVRRAAPQASMSATAVGAE